MMSPDVKANIKQEIMYPQNLKYMYIQCKRGCGKGFA